MKGLDLLTVHDFVHFGHASDDFLHADVESFSIIVLTCIKRGDDSINERSGILDHVDMDKDEACFRRLWIKTVLEGPDQTKVVILKTPFWILEAIIEESI